MAAAAMTRIHKAFRAAGKTKLAAAEAVKSFQLARPPACRSHAVWQAAAAWEGI
jgi:hypothetical protein